MGGKYEVNIWYPDGLVRGKKQYRWKQVCGTQWLIVAVCSAIRHKCRTGCVKIEWR
jgi:hypothetical protein